MSTCTWSTIRCRLDPLPSVLILRYRGLSDVMAAADEHPPDSRRRIPVRLTEVPPMTRLDAAIDACKAEPDPDERALILSVALDPSDDVHWIAA
jgi:hypothetical protein